jgi:hypothetical protein
LQVTRLQQNSSRVELKLRKRRIKSFPKDRKNR